MQHCNHHLIIYEFFGKNIIYEFGESLIHTPFSIWTPRIKHVYYLLAMGIEMITIFDFFCITDALVSELSWLLIFPAVTNTWRIKLGFYLYHHISLHYALTTRYNCDFCLVLLIFVFILQYDVRYDNYFSCMQHWARSWRYTLIDCHHSQNLLIMAHVLNENHPIIIFFCFSLFLFPLLLSW